MRRESVSEVGDKGSEGGGISWLRSFFKPKNAKVVNLGASEAAPKQYYDEHLKRWVFEGEEV